MTAVLPGPWHQCVFPSIAGIKPNWVLSHHQRRDPADGDGALDYNPDDMSVLECGPRGTRSTYEALQRHLQLI